MMIRNNKKAVAGALICCVLLSGCAASAKNAGENKGSGEMELAVTSPAICEILDALEYDNVTGVPQTSRELPQRYEGAQMIGSPMNPDLELLAKLSPDLVLSPKTLEDSLSQNYRAAGISSAFLELGSVEGMYGAITSLGTMLDREEQAKTLVTEYENYMEAYENEVKERPSVLILMTFPDGFYLVATENSYVGNLVKHAGGDNVYGAEYEGDTSGFANISPEDIVQKKPDYVMVFAHYNEEEAFAYMKQEFADDQTWQYFDAVKEGRIIYLPSQYFGMSAALSWTEALEYLQPYLHGDVR